MDTETELKALRYLINDLILYIYDMRCKLDEIVPTKLATKLVEPNPEGTAVSFDLFNIRRDKYDSLIAQYGVDVVNRACVKLDEFIKINSYIPYGRANDALGRKFIKEVLFEDSTKARKSKGKDVTVTDEG